MGREAVMVRESQAVLLMTDWITDRRPTEADADKDGDVRIRYSPYSEDYSFVHPFHVGAGVPWKHCAEWKPAPAEFEPAEFEPARSPRKFVLISRTAHRDGSHTVDVIDDEGIAWWMVPGETGWQRLADLPFREVPADA
jgi:hypothetical protein